MQVYLSGLFYFQLLVLQSIYGKRWQDWSTMASIKTEYFEEFCTGKKKKHVHDSHDFVMCSSDFARQPVGGRVAEARRQLQADSAPPPRLPACDQDYVATIYSGIERATHRVEPCYKVIWCLTDNYPPIMIIISGQCLWCCHHDLQSMWEFTRFTWWIQNSARWLPTSGPSRPT